MLTTCWRFTLRATMSRCGLGSILFSLLPRTAQSRHSRAKVFLVLCLAGACAASTDDEVSDLRAKQASRLSRVARLLIQYPNSKPLSWHRAKGANIGESLNLSYCFSTVMKDYLLGIKFDGTEGFQILPPSQMTLKFSDICERKRAISPVVTSGVKLKPACVRW